MKKIITVRFSLLELNKKKIYKPFKLFKFIVGKHYRYARILGPRPYFQLKSCLMLRPMSLSICYLLIIVVKWSPSSLRHQFQALFNTLRNTYTTCVSTNPTFRLDMLPRSTWTCVMKQTKERKSEFPKPRNRNLGAKSDNPIVPPCISWGIKQQF